MKMIAAGSALPSQYATYVHNCLRNAACEPEYYAPVPAISAVQLYVAFGSSAPGSVEFTLIDVCNQVEEQIVPSEYIVGDDPEGNFYGVFKGFNTPVTTPSIFIIHLAAGGQSFFSEAMVVETCISLMKVLSCHPAEARETAFDVNGVYYGLPISASAGMDGLSYTHVAWQRHGKVRELSNKATFVSSLYATYRSTVERIFQTEGEFVPQWYKDYFLALYSRGMVQVNDGKIYIVSDLAFEPINDDDLLWKPQAQLKETHKLFFGCDVFCVTESESDQGGGSEPSGSGSESPPENNYFLTAAFNFSIDEVFGPVGLPDLPPTGVNGAQSGVHSGVEPDEGINVVLTGSIVLTCRLIIFVDNVQVACQNITGAGTYIFSLITVLPGQELRITINTGTC